MAVYAHGLRTRTELPLAQFSKAFDIVDRTITAKATLQPISTLEYHKLIFHTLVAV
jgi:hypothetical protein